ncbi:MAG: hypothetical protein QM775_04985 [Pirellulales bacterium]
MGRLRLTERIAQTDEHLIATQQAEIGHAGFEVRSKRANLHDDVGRLKNFLPGGGERRAAAAVIIVRITGGDAGTRLDDHLQAGLDQQRDRRRHEGHALLAGIRFLYDADFHGLSVRFESRTTDNRLSCGKTATFCPCDRPDSPKTPGKLGGFRDVGRVRRRPSVWSRKSPKSDGGKPIRPPLNKQVANARLLNSPICRGLAWGVLKAAAMMKIAATSAESIAPNPVCFLAVVDPKC